MTREKFIEELNFNCKVDGKEVWLNIMPCLEKLLDEHEAQLKAKNERIKELEEAMKPKTCEQCENHHKDRTIFCNGKKALMCTFCKYGAVSYFKTKITP